LPSTTSGANGRASVGGALGEALGRVASTAPHDGQKTSLAVSEASQIGQVGAIVVHTSAERSAT
jgi:hypothetical protein